MITGPARKKLKTLMRAYLRMARRCFLNADLAKAQGRDLEHKLIRHAAFLHFNAASDIERVLKPAQGNGLRNWVYRKLACAAPAKITGDSRKKLIDIMWHHARWARTCIRDAEGAIERGREQEYLLFRLASFMNLNVAREIEAIVCPEGAPGLRNDDFLGAFFVPAIPTARRVFKTQDAWRPRAQAIF